MNNLYMTLDEYNDFVSRAHAQYMVNRLTVNNTPRKHHPSDLAIESASFFEASYLIIDSLYDTFRNRIQVEQDEKDAEILSLKNRLTEVLNAVETIKAQPKKRRKKSSEGR